MTRLPRPTATDAANARVGARNVQSSMTDSASRVPPVLPTPGLPKAGGALRGLGEKFTTNPSNGTGSLSVPISISPGRPGLELSLGLTYDSGAGNGPFGLGWMLSIPSISRKTDRGVPGYDEDGTSDTYVLSGSEDLVRVPYWVKTGLVFTTQLGTAIDPRNVNRWLAELCERAGVRSIRPHDLRHTCASLLLAQGVPARVVMDILGHSQIAVTMDIYSHVLPVMQDNAAEKIDDVLF